MFNAFFPKIIPCMR